MNASTVTMPHMGRFVWKFSEYLEQRGINPYRIARHGKDKSEEQVIYRLARRGQSIKRLDLASLALIVEAIKTETGEQVSITDLLDYSDEPN